MSHAFARKNWIDFAVRWGDALDQTTRNRNRKKTISNSWQYFQSEWQSVGSARCRSVPSPLVDLTSQPCNQWINLWFFVRALNLWPSFVMLDCYRSNAICFCFCAWFHLNFQKKILLFYDIPWNTTTSRVMKSRAEIIHFAFFEIPFAFCSPSINAMMNFNDFLSQFFADRKNSIISRSQDTDMGESVIQIRRVHSMKSNGHHFDTSTNTFGPKSMDSVPVTQLQRWPAWASSSHSGCDVIWEWPNSRNNTGWVHSSIFFQFYFLINSTALNGITKEQNLR